MIVIPTSLATLFETLLISVLATLLPMIEKWSESINLGGNFGALLTDLLKVLLSFMHMD